MTISRRRLCSAGAALALVGAAGCLEDGATGDERVDDWAWSGTLSVDYAVQYHDPDCGCCAVYVTYLEEHGIDVAVEEVGDLEAVKRDRSIPGDAWSCHTIELGEYLIEGHVPLEAIDTLLADEPDVLGIAAPGMPRHSPGMGPRGDEPLSVVAFEESGEVTEYLEV